MVSPGWCGNSKTRCPAPTAIAGSNRIAVAGISPYKFWTAASFSYAPTRSTLVGNGRRLVRTAQETPYAAAIQFDS